MIRSAIISVGIMTALTSYANAAGVVPISPDNSSLFACGMTSDREEYDLEHVTACCSEILGKCSVCTKSSPKQCWEFPTALKYKINRLNKQQNQEMAPISTPPKKSKFKNKMFPRHSQGKVTRR